VTDAECAAVVAELTRIELSLNDDRLSANDRSALFGAAAGLRWFLEMGLWETPTDTFYRVDKRGN